MDALQVSELRRHRAVINELVLAGVRELPFSDDVLAITRDDAASGFMTEPVPLEDIDLTEVTLTRRIPVREHRAKGWRTRTVDHATESLINGATFPCDRVHHDTIDVLICILLMFMTAGSEPRMWKRDVSKAFRRCPISVEHLDLSWVVFAADGFTGFHDTWEGHSGLPARCKQGIDSGTYWSG